MVADAYLQPNNEFSYEYVTMAVIDRAIIGMVSGYSGAAQTGFAAVLGMSLSRWSRIRFSTVSRASRRITTFINTIPEDDFYVRALAVDEARRGEGVGSLLLEQVEHRARELGSSRLSLDVYAGNHGARRLYERFGMVPEDESRRWFGIPDTNLIRVVKPL